MRMINSIEDINNLQKAKSGETLSDTNVNNGCLIAKELQTIQLRDFSRNVSKYLGCRCDLVGRVGLVAKIFPPSYSEVESSFNEEDRQNLLYAINKIKSIEDKFNSLTQ